jgi:3-oxoacyl-[acyl-carrier protein] reductase
MLTGRIAVITGGAQGIGLAIARTFADHGARVVIGDLNETKVREAAASLAADAIGVRCDVTSSDDMARLLATATDSFGSLDVMVNNAGITRDATMRKMTEQQFDEVIQVHLRGCWNGTRLAAGIMRESRGGSIINMSSISGKVGFVGQTNYSAAKAGIVGLSKAAAKEVAHLGVRVNVIQPGLIRTAMTEAMPQKAWEQKMAEIPMQRAGEPEEIASVALFYASDLSSYMTGTVAEVTGGRLMLPLAGRRYHLWPERSTQTGSGKSGATWQVSGTRTPSANATGPAGACPSVSQVPAGERQQPLADCGQGKRLDLTSLAPRPRPPAGISSSSQIDVCGRTALPSPIVRHLLPPGG